MYTKAGPSGKRIKLDPTDPTNDVRTINKLFPKIENLEHFPLKVLLNIFEQLDCMDLYNLAEHSYRFESIAKMVLNERYLNEYFIVDEIKHSQDTYIDFFKRFGSVIRAFKAKNIKEIHLRFSWIDSLVNRAKNLEKVILERFPIEFVFRHMNKNITHLSLRDCYYQPEPNILSQFRNLEKIGDTKRGSDFV